MLTERPILIVEAQVLIALDIQRVLASLHAGEAVFARSPAELSTFEDRLPGLGLAIIEADERTGWQALARQVVAAGVPLVLVTPDSGLARHARDFAGVPILVKPFLEADILDVVRRALTASG